jgi:cytochrome P450
LAVARTTSRGPRPARNGDPEWLHASTSPSAEAKFIDDAADRFNEHFAFGGSEYYCLGASLARLQRSSIFRGLLNRLPDIELGGEVHHPRSNFIGGIKRLNARFTPQSKRRRARS